MTVPQPGDLLYTRSTGVVGGLIRFGQDVRYHGWRAAAGRAVMRPLPDVDDPTWGNHTAVVVDGSIIEAEARGLTRSPITKYGVTNSLVLPLTKILPGVTDTDRRRVVAFCEHELALHDGYSWLGIASIVAQLITPARLDVSWDGTMICSAFAARAWEHAGAVLPYRSPYTVMPADLRAMTR